MSVQTFKIQLYGIVVNPLGQSHMIAEAIDRTIARIPELKNKAFLTE